MTSPALGINPAPYEQASRNAPIRTFSVSKGPDGRTLDAALKKIGPAPAPARARNIRVELGDQQARVDIRNHLVVLIDDLRLDVKSAGRPDRAGLHTRRVRIGIDERLVERVVL